MLHENWKRTFSIILAGQALSLVGSSAVQFALLWWLTVKTGSAVVLSLATMATFIPQAIIGPFAGIVIDRVPRKTVMIFADALVAASTIGLALWWSLGEIPIYAVYAALALRSVGTSFHTPAMQAAMPMLAPEAELVRVAGWSQTLTSAAAMVGPVAGSFMMSLYSLQGVALIDVGGAVVAIVSLLLVRIPDPARAETPAGIAGVMADMRGGLASLLESRPLWRVTIAVSLVTFAYLPLSSLFPLMVNRHFLGTAYHSGLVEFAFAGGLLVSSTAVGVLGGVTRKNRLIGGAICVLGLAILAAGFLPGSAYIWFVVLSAVMGMSAPWFTAPYTAAVQTEVTPEALGRVFSILGSMMLATTPLGLMVSGPMAEAYGVDTWFSVSGLAIFLVGAFVLYLERLGLGLPD